LFKYSCSCYSEDDDDEDVYAVLVKLISSLPLLSIFVYEWILLWFKIISSIVHINLCLSHYQVYKISLVLIKIKWLVVCYVS